MKMENNNIVNDLKTLKGFCSQSKITGHILHLWFHSLRCRYPKEFLEYTNNNKFHPYYRMKIMEKLDKSISLKFKNREVENPRDIHP